MLKLLLLLVVVEIAYHGSRTAATDAAAAVDGGELRLLASNS
jgi:hypothetical protein